MTDLPPRLPSLANQPVDDLGKAAERLGLIDHGPQSSDSTQSLVPGDLVPYEAPELVGTHPQARLVIIGRGLVAAWAIALVVAALIDRHRAGSHPISSAPMPALGWIGVVLAGLAIGGGWWWSDRHTLNIHRLDGRLPSRWRCVSAWLMPLLWTALLMVTVLRLDPTEVFDVRPMVTTLVFALAMWRPYSLCRRMLRSLTRVDSDILIGIAFVMDLTGFGLLWAALHRWPGTIGPVNVDETASLLGLLLAGCLALLVNVFAWYALAGAFEEAGRIRQASHRTRYEHRQLRQRGIDPMDPQVRWALLRIRHEELAAEEAAAAAAAEAEVAATAAEVARLERFEEAAEVARLERVEEEPGVGGEGTTTAQPSPELESVLEPESPASALVDRIAARSRSDRTGDGAAPGGEPSRVDAGEVAPTAPSEIDVAGGASAGPIERLVARAGEPAPSERDPADAAVARAGEVDSTGAVGGSPLERLSRRLEAGRTVDDAAPLERLSKRLAASGGSRPDILDRLSEHGITPSSTPIPELPPLSREGDAPALAQRVFLLETARYVMLLSLACSAAAVAWLISRAASAGVVDGDIAAGAVDSIDQARRIAIAVVGATLILVPAWATVAAIWIGRTGLDTRRDVQRCSAALAASVVAFGVAFVADPGRGTASAFALLVGIATSVVAIQVVKSIEIDLGGNATALSIWSALLFLAPVTMWAARLDRPTEAGDALESILFFAALQAMAWSVAAILAGVATGTIESRVRLSRVGEDEV